MNLLIFHISDERFVFEDRIEAFKMLKKVRESRVKSFKTYEDALNFAKCGLESPTETESPVIISAELNGALIQNGNTGNCDKSATKGKNDS